MSHNNGYTVAIYVADYAEAHAVQVSGLRGSLSVTDATDSISSADAVPAP